MRAKTWELIPLKKKKQNSQTEFKKKYWGKHECLRKLCKVQKHIYEAYFIKSDVK